MTTLEIQQAITVLRAGGLIALPTETVYGLGGDARNPQALAKIFAAKGRPADHPVIVHLPESEQLREWAEDISAEAWQVAEAFWPGPLTLILKKAPGVLAAVTGGQATVGLRVPAHPLALAILQGFGGGVAAPSANRFGHLSPTTAEAVREELGDKVTVIVDGGPCAVGVESTILDLSTVQPVILRPGMITQAQIAAVLGRPVALHRADAPRVSGSLPSHYAPTTPAVLATTQQLPNLLQSLTGDNFPLACVTYHAPLFSHPGLLWIVMPDQPEPYAHDLYQILRDLDKQQLKKIIIEGVPTTPAWSAIADRLQRATKAKIS